MKNKKESSDKANNPKDRGPKTIQFKVKQEEELMKFLIASLPHKNRNNIKTMLKKRQVVVNGTAISQFNHVLKPGDSVELSRRPAESALKMPGVVIVYEDEHLIVVNKNAGLLTIATEKEKRDTVYSMLSSYVKTQDKSNKIFIVHRLDRETSGLMLFAKSREVKEQIQETWTQTVAERSYLAVVEGHPDPSEGKHSSYLFESKAFIVYSTQDPERGQLAITNYSTMKTSEAFSLLKVNLETGRKNQIRVHMKDLGHPIVGDKKYGSSMNPIRRLGLHAWVLAFKHPLTGKKLRFETSIPGSFLKLF
ncbi:RluA family pseudouridine synthase [Mangrovibacterium marinum]|uniref:Pseudouridine synthase n=1 Tax=Mangrovibacterium marinum TaxID=1639118 RepID=A0A2T5C6X2_9BACT|nr:RluA family pseudouridine synthase [Mangrovibacterium marinum]PTN10695.1 23S rRNA pseudouridine1911/1915/1917 synthase [Mangrovibacterium marinum]